MTRTGTIALGASLALALAGCDGFREAMTAHVDVAARAGSQELSVTQLAGMMGNSQLPLQREVAEGVANIWVDYQLMAQAAAAGDSLKDDAEIREALWAEIAQARVGRVYQSVASQWENPAAPTEAQYAQGDILAARHILFRIPPTALSTAERDSVRRVAEGVRARITPQNFAQLARQYGQDGTAEEGGYLGVFPRGQMVPEFEQAVISLQPGEISPVIQTQFGYHIVQRSPYGEVAEEFAGAYRQHAMQAAESTYLAGLEEAGNVRIRDNAPAVVKKVAQDPEDFRNDRTVIATSAAGDLTAARMAQWINSFPPESQLRGQIAQAPDSIIPVFVRQILRNELLLRQADSANIQIEESEMMGLRSAFTSAVSQIWGGLSLSPDSLQAAIPDQQERERQAASRVDQYLQNVVQNQARFIPIPPPIQSVLREKYEYKLNDAGIDRALERATQIRASADSGRATQGPPSQVPMPQPGQQQGRQQPPPPRP